MPCPCGECQDNKVDLSETLLINPDRIVGNNTVTLDPNAPVYLDPLYLVLSEIADDMVFYSKEDLNEYLDDTEAYLDPTVMILKADAVSHMKIGAV